MHLYFVRHGETELNKKNQFQGHTDNPLNEHGKEQSEKLGKFFKHIPVDGIYSSDLKRAYQTALMIAKYHEVPIQYSELIRERSYGEWEGLNLSELLAEDPENQDVLSFGGKYGVEKIDDVKKRAKQFIDLITMKYKGKSLVIVSHGSFISNCIYYLTDGNVELAVKSLTHTGWTQLTFDDNKGWEAVTVNQSPHLQTV